MEADLRGTALGTAPPKDHALVGVVFSAFSRQETGECLCFQWVAHRSNRSIDRREPGRGTGVPLFGPTGPLETRKSAKIEGRKNAQIC